MLFLLLLLPNSSQGLTMEQLGGMPMATGEEEVFAFARVLSRLSEMSSKQYAELTAGSEAPPEY